jgi:hypothetical protein
MEFARRYLATTHEVARYHEKAYKPFSQLPSLTLKLMELGSYQVAVHIGWYGMNG